MIFAILMMISVKFTSLSVAYRQDFRLGGTHPPFSLLPSLPSLFPFLFPSYPSFPLPFPPVRSRPPEFQLAGLGSAVSFSSGVWGGTPAEVEFGAFSPQNITSGGNNFQ